MSLRAQLAPGELLIAPGVFDMISARIADASAVATPSPANRAEPGV